jgi:hypothetical protein
VKVHNQQCKYLAQKKVLPQVVHDTASCSGCLKQIEIERLGESTYSIADKLVPFCVDNCTLAGVKAHRVS